MSKLLGANIISPLQGDWHGFQLPLIRRARFEVGKVQISDTYATAPENVEQLLDALVPGPNGRKTIIMRAEEVRFDAPELWHEVVERGLNDLIGRRGDVDWYLEVGNEPDLSGVTVAQQIAWHRSALKLKRTIGHGRLSWLASLPTQLGQVEQLLASGALDGYDGFGAHVYGHYRLDDGGSGQWLDILNHLLTLDRAIWITELGINDPGTDKEEKGRRIVDWLNRQPARVVGGVVFCVGRDTQWPQYELDADMARAFARRERAAPQQEPPARTFPSGYPLGGPAEAFEVPPYGRIVVSGPFLSYWRQHGGLPLFGYPVSPLLEEEGRPVQYFERNRFEYHADNPEPHRVLLGRLGADLYDARYRKRA